ncbi:MAG TPA: hypothetical protein V6C78_04625 [Crinalium sp.]
MYSYLSQTIPTVIISNTSEAFFEYMSRANTADERAQFIEAMRTLGDRNLLYPKAEKLVFVSAPIPHAQFLLQKLGYLSTHYSYPQNPSPFLSLDILREENLLHQIVQYAGIERTLQLIPHATTPEFLKLVQCLQQDYQINVLLPESPDLDCLWFRDYIDTKSGFRALVSQWLPNANERLIEGFVCQTIEQAAYVVSWFLRRDTSCLVKSDRSNDALGHTIFKADELLPLSEIVRRLNQNSFLEQDLILVEEYIASPQRLFPSVELFVPALDSGSPQMTYVCNQIFHESGTFAGLLVSREFESERWYVPLVESGLQIAQRLQKSGYVGHFDVDAIVDSEGQLFLLEINARRTGGTHVHELACSLFGPHYLDDVVLLSNSAIDTQRVTQFDQLIVALNDFLYPMHQKPEGIMITHSSALLEHKFGGIFIASSTQRVLELQQQILAHV